jgi:hypothetical protein
MQDMADLISFIKNWRYLDSGPSGTAQTKPPLDKAGVKRQAVK